ncbi:hypothetical protein [Rhizobium sp. CECT 9324]|jgi:hypothetical protein|uniref:hypothetical protein n=1 Tax=Rhizobium sp. CECT 9324 TaxID=2845820 RepID=UPI001E4B4987|nr:hypothetical protein [Rhizobium sp. CECT 9324]CAH0339287.1 hypothetical protein RHI9324_00928 [Rhizobium sp. CECT 9324]
MPTLKEVEFYLMGLWLLFKRDAAGFTYLDLSDRGALRSFWAIGWALPAIVVSFIWWRMLFSGTLPEGASVGGLFYFRLMMVEAMNWVLPIILVGILCWMIGIGEKFAPIVVVANWLSLPVSFSYAVLVLLMMLIPALSGLIALLWFLLMLTLIVVLFRILQMIIGDHILSVATVTMVLLVPSMLIAEMLERYLGVYPG